MRFDEVITDAESTERQRQAQQLDSAATDLLNSNFEVQLQGFTPRLEYEQGDFKIIVHGWQNSVPDQHGSWEPNNDDRNCRFGLEIWHRSRLVLRLISSKISGSVIEIFRRGPWEAQLLELADSIQDTDSKSEHQTLAKGAEKQKSCDDFVEDDGDADEFDE